MGLEEYEGRLRVESHNGKRMPPTSIGIAEGISDNR